MAHKKFIAAVIEIYGDYASEKLEDMTYLYLQERFKESELDNIFKIIIIKVNPKFKTPPSPADFEEIFFKKSDKEYEVEALAWWKEINKHSTMYDVTISDIRVQTVIEDFGGWDNFGRRDTDAEHFHQKKFVDLFKLYSTTPPENTPRILSGSGNYYNPQPPILIGDREKCKTLLEMNKVNSDQAMQAIENMTKEMRI